MSGDPGVQVVPVGTSVEVEIATLSDLGNMLLREADGFTMGAAGVLFPMAGTNPNFAGNGLVEGATFASAHETVRMSLTELLNDVVQGLTTLGNAALAISAEYGDADAFGAATVASVRAAFTPTEPPGA
jgi:hypothetical protein